MRRDLPELVRQLRLIEGLQSLSITTNGILLKQQARVLAETGLTRVNVSLDSLLREKFSRLTRRDQMDRVIEGLEEIERYPDVHPIKINAVAIRNFSEEEVEAGSAQGPPCFRRTRLRSPAGQTAANLHANQAVERWGSVVVD